VIENGESEVVVGKPSIEGNVIVVFLLLFAGFGLRVLALLGEIMEPRSE